MANGILIEKGPDKPQGCNKYLIHFADGTVTDINEKGDTLMRFSDGTIVRPGSEHVQYCVNLLSQSGIKVRI